MGALTTARAKDQALSHVANELLTLIEIEEARLLNWGFIQGSLDLKSQVSKLLANLPTATLPLWQELQAQGIDAEAMLDQLANRRLIFRQEDGNFRSRFAECIRLLYLLRQRMSGLDWATARKLVSDLRLQLQRRSYPKRDLSLAELETILQTHSLTPLQRAVIRNLMLDKQGQSLLLARFQVEAIVRQLDNMSSGRDRGAVIGAGTGAGKTKAFYIPAFAHIAEAIDPTQPSVQAIAIYPRIELLKDQLAEAFEEARKLDATLRKATKRPVSMGAYYGNTPASADALLNYAKSYGWKPASDGNGYICPTFACPRGANHALVWEKRNLEAERAANLQQQYGTHARLRCTTCDFETLPGELILTRLQMRNAPPDILFTTTEMVNRQLSQAEGHTLFGINQPRPPRLMLLDEIHTYEGITGAQVAYLLRRWRHARGYTPGKNLCIVGLSATLTNAVDFFAKLTGIPPYEIDYLTPKETDLIEEGIEYNVVIKGDPVSGTSLLSTSIQTGMLLARTLDPFQQPRSQMAYGQRVFAFTDKLDVINRWFQSMYDAETTKTLSKWRLPDGDAPIALRRAQGQVWDMPQKVGHDLRQPLPLSRTTSQDPGVNDNTKLVIATSTLEVGFNDPRVGAVMQHKAPRSMASFLQRKGRAGRVRGMRPWTVVITSAYGRDRWAFQHAESLFNPLLPPIELPLENYYVRKIQAAYALMDWAALQLRATKFYVNVWQLLSTGNAYEKSEKLDNGRYRLRALLLQLLQGTRRPDFELYLQRALAMDAKEPAFQNILWGEPRSLYFEVIPTLLRQLETHWRTLRDTGETPWDDQTANYPMPEFVPASLFGDLNLPEVQIILPERQSQRNQQKSSRKVQEPEGEESQESLPIADAISEFAPGRATKRYVLHYKQDIAHWLALPEAVQLSRGVLNLDLLDIRFDAIARQVALYNAAQEEVVYKIYRPLEYRLSEVPTTIRSTSFAELTWRTHFAPQTAVRGQADGDGAVAIFDTRSSWAQLIRTVQHFTQSSGTWVDITRFAIGVRTDTRFKGGDSSRRVLMFEDKDGWRDVGIGFTVAVDALKFMLAPLDVTALRTLPTWPTLYQNFGPEFFRHKLHHDIRLLEAGFSSFTIDWLWQLELSMLTATAVARQCSLVSAAEEVNLKRPELADRTLHAIFQSQLSDEEDVQLIGRLHEQLLEAMHNSAVVMSLNQAATVLWDDHTEKLDEWLTECYTASLGATLITALTRLVPDMDPDELTMDIEGYSVWISEKTAGGVGLISKLTEMVTLYPRQLELQLADVTQHCDRAELAQHLHSITRLVAAGDPELATAFQALRTTVDLPGLIVLKDRLSRIFRERGIPAGRSVLVALNSKFLRPNSQTDSDQLVTRLVESWGAEEKRLGIAIDLRVIAVAARRIEEIEARVQALLKRIQGDQAKADESQIFNLLQSLLWLTCHDSCPECIETWQPYQQLPRPSRALVNTLLKPDQPPIIFGSPGWQESIDDELTARYQVQIACQVTQKEELKVQISRYLTTPIEIGHQRFFAIVERSFRQDALWLIQLVLRELVGY